MARGGGERRKGRGRQEERHRPIGENETETVPENE